MRIIEGAGEFRPPAPGEANDYIEQMRVPDMSIGTY